ncbi:MAG: DUF3798 domain-containing protein [Synergistaceae bacterium]|nr:DUF3798 domain-containing protein [Synergistaceae bacterium]
MSKKTMMIIGAIAVLVLGFFIYQSSNKPAEQAQEEAKAPEKAAFHIGIVTGTVSQSEDDLRGAELAIQKYGDVSTGGMIKHLTYPDNFMSEMETTIAQIAGLADDPDMKVVVVNQAIPGTAEGFRRIKEKRPDILCFAGEAHEDPNVIASVADLTINADFVSRGYLIIHTAKELGCDTFVHISFPRHMSYETLGRRRLIMEQACNDMGLKFVFETAPDPTSDVGVAGAQQFILEKTPAWVNKYGKNTAFFCTNDAHTEPLLKQLAKHGGFFIEADLPSPLMGYPGAFGIDLAAEAGNWPVILKKVEEAVADAGAAGRMGTWAFSYGYTNSVALAEFGKRIVEGTAKLDSKDDLMACYGEYTPGAAWNGNFYTDLGTGVTRKNHLLVYQDTYIFGKGFMNAASVEVPEKYSQIKMTN